MPEDRSAATVEPIDVVIVGGGSAGLSAALALSRARRRVLVVDRGTPRNRHAKHLHGYLSRDGAEPAELLEIGRREVGRYGGEFHDGKVTAIVKRHDEFHVALAEGGSLRARRVLISTGVTDELPEIPGVSDRFGIDVLHCPYCHGYEVRYKAVAVLANDPEAVDEALMLRQWSQDVTLLLHSVDPQQVGDDHMERLAARDIRVIPGKIVELLAADDQLSAVRVADGRTVDCEALFVAPRLWANDELLAALDVELDRDERSSWVKADEDGATSVAGVWAAGNLTDPSAQLLTAAESGSRAAIAINADLIDEDVEQAVAARRASAKGGDPPADQPRRSLQQAGRAR
ncbi:MAG: NAD(P)/FAD-dependent oxidoreductase [Actinomycetota bacterium]|nr:NAD(P)/FAD-dependent oxidoreductase [Actinomycetota bacterium]